MESQFVSIRIEWELPFVLALAADPAVGPFLAPRTGEEEGLRELLDQAPLGLFVIERGGGGQPGALALQLVSKRSRLCQLSRLMVSPRWRGIGIALEAVRQACRVALLDLGLHRVQAEVYGDDLASQRRYADTRPG